MNPILQAIINALLKYLDQHPEQVEHLVTALIDWLIKQIPHSPPKV